MIHKMFSIYDEKAEAYLKPFFFPTIGMATRAITDCVNDVNHDFCAHSSDYTLFLLGEWDDDSAMFHEAKQSLGNLVEFKTQHEMFVKDEKQTKLNLIGGTQ